MISVSSDSISSAYLKLLNLLHSSDSKVSPRGFSTKELFRVFIDINDPRKSLLNSSERALNPAFLAFEFFWIFNGDLRLEPLKLFNSNMANYSDDGIIMNAPYGYRLRSNFGIDQLNQVVTKLNNDRDSRQAVCIIFDPAKDFKVTKDVPCNDLLKFTIRDNKLFMSTYVRSQDIITGFPYDVFHWMLLQQILAYFLDTDIGSYLHMVDSLHVYDHDFSLFVNVLVKMKSTSFSNIEFKMISMTDISKTISFDLFSDIMSSFYFKFTSKLHDKLYLLGILESEKPIEFISGYSIPIFEDMYKICALYAYRKLFKSDLKLSLSDFLLKHHLLEGSTNKSFRNSAWIYMLSNFIDRRHESAKK